MPEEMHETDHRAVALDPGAVETLLEMVGDDLETLREIVEAFLADAPERLGEITAGLAAGDPGLVRRAAHTLKANGLTFGALAFAESCRQLEDVARGQDLAGAAPLAAQIERDWPAVRPAVEALAAGAGT